MNASFWEARRCLREPIPEIAEARALLDHAANAHLSGDRIAAHSLIRAADLPAVRAWTESIWGKHNNDILRERLVPNAPPRLNVVDRPKPRMPIAAVRRKARERDGYHCRFCGIAVIDKSIRTLLSAAYPEALAWGRRNADQHAAFQCMWLQYDHLMPNGRGGDSSLDNVVVTCAPCNFGRMERTLAEVGVLPPAAPTASAWDGLMRLVTPAQRLPI